MNITSFLNQTASHKSAIIDGYGGVTYGTASTINVRWVSKFELVMNTDRKEVVSRAVIITENVLSVNDYLALTDGEDDQEGIVIAVGSTPSVDGNTKLNKVWLV